MKLRSLKLFLPLLAATAALGQASLAMAQAPASALEAQAPTVRPAINGVMDAFKTHSLVGIGDAHGLAQEQDFYAAIMRDPRFAREVGNVVVEFGGAQHQAIIDRYVNGEDVPYIELRKVWSDAVGWVPYPGYVGFMNFYAQIRATNLTLPPEQRIKVWLGQPPVDWSKITTGAELQPFIDGRDAHAADVILNNVLDKGRKALVIYGTTHFDRRKPKGVTLRSEPLAGSQAAVRKLLTDAWEGRFDPAILAPGLLQAMPSVAPMLKHDLTTWGEIRSVSFLRAAPYGRADTFEVKFANETRSVTLLLDREGRIEGFTSLASEQTWLIDLVEAKRPGAFYVIAPYSGFEGRPCEGSFEQAMMGWPKPALATAVATSTLPQKAKAAGCEVTAQNLYADAMLYVGPGSELVTAPTDPSLILDEAFRREISRRYQIMTGQPLGPVNIAANPSAPQGYHRGAPAPSAPSKP